MNFEGQVAISTGAASGMGLLFSQSFAALGGNVVLCDINEEVLVQKVAEINEKVPVLKENGGYIFSSDHSIPNDVSLENMKKIIAEVKRLGSYK